MEIENLSISNQKLLLAVELGYRVTDDGKLISPRNKELIGVINTTGYRTFKVSRNYPVAVHRLMGYQKFGEKIFDPSLEIRHLNGNRLDNSFENISIGTHQENMLDIDKKVRQRAASNAHKKYKNVEEIRNYFEKEKSYSKTMEKFGITSKGTLNYILYKSGKWEE